MAQRPVPPSVTAQLQRFGDPVPDTAGKRKTIWHYTGGWYEPIASPLTQAGDTWLDMLKTAGYEVTMQATTAVTVLRVMKNPAKPVKYEFAIVSSLVTWGADVIFLDNMFDVLSWMERARTALTIQEAEDARNFNE